jgi:glycosyltransferase involved in cell wall biosynthesis
MEEMDRRLQVAADTVICCSRKIYENVAKQVPAEKLFYFQHRVDFGKFNKARRDADPLDLREIPRPRIGYYGTLSDSNDWKIIQYCAEKRPDYQFVFIGRKDIAVAGVEHLPNIHFLGKKPFEKIQNYGAGFDVAIMFWVRREWIKHCSPLKLKEYLSLGVPVVSTPIEEVERDYADIVHSAETPEEFLSALDTALTQDNSERVQKGLSRVSGDTWSDIIPIIEGV